MTRRARIEIDECVRVAIRGFPASDEEQRRHRRPICPHDHGLVRDFMRWMLDNDIHPPFPATSGGGVFTAYFNAEDIPDIRAWLEEHNVME